MAIERKELDTVLLEKIEEEASLRLDEIRAAACDSIVQAMDLFSEQVSKCDRDSWTGEIIHGIHAMEDEDLECITIWLHLAGVRVFLAANWPESSIYEIASSVLLELRALEELPNPLAAIAAVRDVSQSDLEELQEKVNRDFVTGGKMLKSYDLGDLKFTVDRNFFTDRVTATANLGWGEVAIFGGLRPERLDVFQAVNRIKKIAMAQLSEFLPEN